MWEANACLVCVNAFLASGTRRRLLAQTRLSSCFPALFEHAAPVRRTQSFGFPTFIQLGLFVSGANLLPETWLQSSPSFPLVILVNGKALSVGPVFLHEIY